MRLTDKWVIPSESLCCLSCHMNDYNKTSTGACRHMKDILEVFNENLLSIYNLLDSGNLRGCFIGSANLTMFSAMANYDDGVIITEVMQGVFSEVGPLFDEYQIDEKEKEQIITEMKNSVGDIIKSYNDKNKNNLYLALKNLRHRATQFQMKCWKMMKKTNGRDLSVPV